MASVKKSTLPLRPSVNPKIATTTIAKPIVKQSLVSKVASSVIVKKSAVTVKTTSEKITAVKSTTLLKSSTIKSAVLSSPAKMTTTKSPVKVSATPVKSAADSTSTLKVKSVVKPLAKTSSTALTKPASKLIASTPAVKKPTTIASKSAGVTAAKSTTVLTTPKVSAVKSSNLSSTPVKARSLSITNTKTAAAAVTKTLKPIAIKNPPSTVARTSTKLTSSPLSPKSTKAIVGAKTPLKSSTAVKPVARTTTASAKRVTPADVIKRVQDASEIEIRDADSTTLEEKEVEECISKDSSSCENDENGDAKQKSEVDEERVYAVAEQLICVMQPEELEVITGDIVEQLNKDSYVIDMSAVEAEEINAEASLTDTNNDSVPVSEIHQLQTSLSENEVTNIETVSDVRNTTDDEKATILEVREINTQEMTNMDCSANDVLETAEDTPVDEESAETGSLIDAKETEFPPLASAEDEEMTSFIEQDALECDEPHDDDQNEFFGNAPCPSVDFENVHEKSDTYSGVPDDEFETLSEVEPTANDTSDAAEQSEKSCTSGAEVASSEANECEQLVDDDIQPATDISFSGFTESNECEELISSSPMACDVELSQHSTDEMMTLHNEEEPESGFDIASNMDEAKVDEPLSVEMNASLVDVDDFSENSVEPEPTNFHEVSINLDPTEELICLGVPSASDFSNSASDESEFSTPNERSIVMEQRSENFMAFGNFEDVLINMSYADVVLSSKTSSDDDGLVEIVRSDVDTDFQLCPPLIHVPQNVDDVSPHSADVCVDETAENRQISSVTVIDSDVGSSIPIYSIYDNTEFTDAVPSDEHYEKQDHEVDQHDETFHKIRHKRNKRRNKKNRKSVSSSENVEEESPKNVHSEKPNHQAPHHGRSRRNSRRWRNSRAYFEAFHQPQQSHQQEYYRDSHWKYTDAKSD